MCLRRGSKSTNFLSEASLAPARRRGRRRQNTDPDLQGKVPRSFNARDGDSVVFSDSQQIPELVFSGFQPLLPPESPTPAVASL